MRKALNNIQKAPVFMQALYKCGRINFANIWGDAQMATKLDEKQLVEFKDFSCPKSSSPRP